MRVGMLALEASKKQAANTTSAAAAAASTLATPWVKSEFSLMTPARSIILVDEDSLPNLELANLLESFSKKICLERSQVGLRR
jgi:hypothetical protein